jgi:signal transduction histidine kinase
MFRSLTGSRNGRFSDPSLWLSAFRIGLVAVVLVTLPFSSSAPTGVTGIVFSVALGISGIAWILWVIGRDRGPLFVTALIVLAASGGTLAGLSSLSWAIALSCVVPASAGIRLRPEISLAITAETVAAFLISGFAVRAPGGTLVGYPLAFIGLWAFALTRYAYVTRARQAEQMLEQTQRAHAAETEAAALAERTRIAREIHDVLAHSLAAVSVNLQAAEGLLAGLPDQGPEHGPGLAKAIECVERAGVFTRDGLAEARRAIQALRDNAVPLPEQLATLASEHQAAGDATVGFGVSGTPRPVPAEAGLAVYRTAQESLTNARKHAPGQPVTLRLEFLPEEIALRAASPLPPVTPQGPSAGSLAAVGTVTGGTVAGGSVTGSPVTGGPVTGGTAATGAPGAGSPGADSLGATGGGHGLTGLRERAALGGGTFTAGPEGGQWVVCLRIPS